MSLRLNSLRRICPFQDLKLWLENSNIKSVALYAAVTFGSFSVDSRLLPAPLFIVPLPPISQLLMKLLNLCIWHQLELSVLSMKLATTIQQATTSLLQKLRVLYLCLRLYLSGFPGGTNGKEHSSQSRRHKRTRLDSWVGKIPWRRAWQRTQVSLPRESHGQRRLAGYGP